MKTKTTRVICILISLILILGMLPIISLSGMAAYAGGDGSKKSPYQIANADQLLALANEVNGGDNKSGKYFKLTADISLKGVTWPGIGDMEHYFYGSFDGAGHRISDLDFFDEHRYCAGLFGMAGPGAEIKNLTLANSTVGGADQVGGIVGYAESCTVSNCKVEGCNIYGVTAMAQYGTGGIVGRLCSFDNSKPATVYHCTVQNGAADGATMTEGGWVGGVIGAVYVDNGGVAKIEGCTNKAWVKTNRDKMGGIIGQITLNANKTEGPYAQVNVYRCSNWGGLKGGSGGFVQHVGGIVGCVLNDTVNNGLNNIDISQCWNRGDFHLEECDSNRTGGIVGYLYQTNEYVYSNTVRWGYSTGNIILSELTKTGLASNPQLYYYGGVVGSEIGGAIYKLAYLCNTEVNAGVESFVTEDLGTKKKNNTYHIFKLENKDTQIDNSGTMVSLRTFLNAGDDANGDWVLGDDGWPIIEIKDEQGSSSGGDTADTTAAAHVHTLTKVPAKDPTETEAGNSEYYVCEECGKWFADSEGKTEITDKTSVQIPARGKTTETYKVTAGGGAEYVSGSGKDLVFKTDADAEKLVGVKIDGAYIAGEFFSSDEKSGEITLKDKYLSGLKPGEHSVDFAFSDGDANTSFKVIEASSSVKTVITISLIILLILIAIIVAVIIIKKKLDRQDEEENKKKN